MYRPTLARILIDRATAAGLSWADEKMAIGGELFPIRAPVGREDVEMTTDGKSVCVLPREGTEHVEQLGGLGLESISYVYLIAEIQQYYGLKDQLITQLRVRGTPLKDLRAADLADMVYQIQNAPAVHGSAQGVHP